MQAYDYKKPPIIFGCNEKGEFGLIIPVNCSAADMPAFDGRLGEAHHWGQRAATLRMITDYYREHFYEAYCRLEAAASTSSSTLNPHAPEFVPRASAASFVSGETLTATKRSCIFEVQIVSEISGIPNFRLLYKAKDHMQTRVTVDGLRAAIRAKTSMREDLQRLVVCTLNGRVQVPPRGRVKITRGDRILLQGSLLGGAKRDHPGDNESDSKRSNATSSSQSLEIPASHSWTPSVKRCIVCGVSLLDGRCLDGHSQEGVPAPPEPLTAQATLQCLFL